MITVERLRRSFGDLVAVDDVSFEVRDGEILGLLGPNGAGKTTTINMIAGVLKPDSGRVLVDGRDIWLEPTAVKRQLGVVPQEVAVYEDLTARDNLSFWGSLYGLSGGELKARVDEGLTRVGLAERAGDRVRGFSGGMKRRLNLCMGLLHRPRFLLLDEPTVGIDPQARLNILEVIREVAGGGTTVLYTTHYMEEAQELCDRIAIIDHGRILTVGTLGELTRLAGEAEVLRLTGGFAGGEALNRLQAIAGVRVLQAGDGSAMLSVAAGGPGLLAVLPAVLASGLALDDVSIKRPDLQSVFISLTGRELRD
ncbi:MAG TPA: ABC transporter ATP-binding protein [Thermoanaerobaculales bacterium]|nr:ABC transporter ATP-binding protein [Thermoanaerobaculales bacterium]HPA80353.1 ABC transporter ATP-binding protein [Thermoanaerobaculales bacterium]HQL29040.1 ABC transporter ATP-binding protein [Thermoanaerobaculales bacterium]HQN97032.1 ABC transporter ATP-binding protein [Thermoanaerobaculales bacterium]HQP42024.1 ABC transporter ATP-binding protein [Thermoanaerobaculales bacterium]